MFHLDYDSTCNQSYGLILPSQADSILLLAWKFCQILEHSCEVARFLVTWPIKRDLEILPSESDGLKDPGANNVGHLPGDRQLVGSELVGLDDLIGRVVQILYELVLLESDGRAHFAAGRSFVLELFAQLEGDLVVTERERLLDGPAEARTLELDDRLHLARSLLPAGLHSDCSEEGVPVLTLVQFEAHVQERI